MGNTNSKQQTPTPESNPPVEVAQHIHGPIGCTCCGLQDNQLTTYDQESMDQQKEYTRKEQMVARMDKVHAKPGKYCITIQSINNEEHTDDSSDDNDCPDLQGNGSNNNNNAGTGNSHDPDNNNSIQNNNNLCNCFSCSVGIWILC